MKRVPINTTPDGCAFTIRTGYERHAYLNGMTRGGDFTQQRACLKSRKILNPCLDGTCKTIYARLGRLSWENYLGRLEHGGWDTQMTCILEVWTKG